MRDRVLSLAVLVSACFVDETPGAPGSGENNGTSSGSGPSSSATATTPTGPTSETSEPPSSSTDGSSGDTPSICGNGLVEAGELCDDGDDQVADGCNPDCRPSGSVIWAVQLEQMVPDTDHVLHDVIVDGDQVLAIGQLGIDETDVGRPFSLVVAAEDGEQIAFHLEDHGWELWQSLAIAPDRSWVAVAGWRDPPAANFQGVALSRSVDLASEIARDVFGSPKARDELTTVVMRPDGVAIYGGALTPEPVAPNATMAHLEAREIDGTLLWARDAFGTGNAIAEIALAGDGSIFIVGAITSNTLVEGWAAKLSPDGMVVEWEHAYPSADMRHEFMLGLALDGDGNVLVGGGAFGDDSAIRLRKLNSINGGTIWSRSYDGRPAGADAAFDVAAHGTSAIIVGFSQRAGEGENLWVRKYDEDGLELWTFVEDGPDHGSDAATAVTTDDAGNIYVTGRQWIDGLHRARLIKLTP
jgi:cysteine-rich repeat protein